MSWHNKFWRWGSISPMQRKTLVEAAFFLGVSRAILICVPFRWIVPHLKRTRSNGQSAKIPELQLQKQIKRAVTSAARYVPWEALCLPQAMTAKWMLERRGYHSILHLGVGRKDSGEMLAHAWLETDGGIVVGAASRALVVPLARFGDE